MKKKSVKTCENDITSSISPIEPLEALRRNLLYAALDTISEIDMEEVVKKQLGKAKGGDIKSAKLILDLVNTSPPHTAPSVSMKQSVLVADGQHVDWKIEARKTVACLISFCGPQTTEDVAARLNIGGAQAIEVLSSEWFLREAGKWHLCNQARNTFLDNTARMVAVEVSEKENG